jgi:hypothetical protein
MANSPAGVTRSQQLPHPCEVFNTMANTAAIDHIPDVSPQVIHTSPLGQKHSQQTSTG